MGEQAMPDSTSARGKSAPQRASAAREDQRGHGRAPALAVRYWKKMRMNKVYPFVVSWVGAGRDGGEPIAVRLVMAGAQVVPAELTMDPNEPRGTATFYVTPLARGGLRGEKVEVLHQGKKIQEIRMPCHVTSQASTVVWLVLAFLLPWLMMHFFMYSPIGYKPPVNLDGTEKEVEKPWMTKRTNPKEPSKPIYVEDDSAALITKRVKHNTPDLKSLVGDFYEDVQSFPGNAYAHLFRNYRDLDQPLALYVFVILLCVTFVSFLVRMERRRRVTGRPLPIGAEGDAD
jgi:hypothetical protein